MTLEGLDVSHWQGKITGWDAVAASGRRFVMIKATDGVTVDPCFHENRQGAHAAGLIVGTTHYAEPSENAEKNALNMATTIGSTEGELPPALDIEITGGLGVTELVQWIHTFTSTLHQKTGRNPMIYTYPSFWEKEVGNSGDFVSHPLWVAEYGTPHPSLPGGWPTWTFWQYSNAGSVPGVSARVDLDHFNGDEAQLAKLTKNHT